MTTRATAVQTAPIKTETHLLTPVNLFERMEQVREEIQRRAFEIFEGSGRPLGQNLDHWFRAESEMLHPVPIQITESDTAFTVRAEVPGFQAAELEITTEPRSLTITGKREAKSEQQEKGKTIYREQFSDEVMRVVGLPSEVTGKDAKATLNNGVLEVVLPKAAEVRPRRVEVRTT